MEIEQKRLQERLRKADWRARQKAISEGTYVATPLERAKELLESMEAPDLSGVYADEAIGKLLTPEDKKPLSNFLFYLKQKRKKHEDDEAKKQEEEKMNSEKGRLFVSQKTYDLQQALLMQLNEDERKNLIKETIETNLFLFLEYMEEYQAPSNDFLRIVVGLQNQIQPSSFTELFVRVCTYQKIEDLVVTTEMVRSAICFLVERKKDDKAAYGLLRMIYQNSISLSTFPLATLIKFQDEYEQTILRFFKGIRPLETQIADSLPPTAFCFTSPIMQALKEEGRVFYTQVPYQFMPFLIEIACYSFNESSQSFDKFISCFKQGMMVHYNSSVQNGFTDLMQKVLEEVKTMKSRFFKTLDYCTTILERGFELIFQRKVEHFTISIISDIVMGDHETLMQLNMRPSMINQGSSVKLKPILRDIKSLNGDLNLAQFDLSRELDDSGKQYFQSVGISYPLAAQIIGFNFCTSKEIEGRWILQLYTGCGKTALSFVIGCHYVARGQKVLITNSSEELTFRDYKKAEAFTPTSKVQVQFRDPNQRQGSIQDGITYLSYDSLTQVQETLSQEDYNNIILIVDECDSIVFNSTRSINQITQSFQSFPKSFGLTGSDFRDYHLKLTESVIGGKVVRIRGQSLAKQDLQCHGVEVFDKISDFREVISTLCQQQAQKTPIIIIADDERSCLQKKLQKSGIVAESLGAIPFPDSVGYLTIFNRKQGTQYPVFIINDLQGRGLDFPSSTEIEENGGVYLVIAKLPGTFLQYKQFLGRTGRISNKGQYSVILFDSEAKNCEGSAYLTKKLEALQNQDMVKVSSQSSIIVSANTQNGEKQYQFEQTQSPPMTGINTEVACTVEVKSDIPEPNQEEEKKNDPITDQQQEGKKEEPIELELNSKHQRPRELKQREKGSTRDNKLAKKLQLQEEARDEIYFENYSKIEIHDEMCSDERRLEAYRTAIKCLSRDLIVADVGAGTGVLSFMAAEEGARMVYAIEAAKISNVCKKQTKERNLGAIIKVMQCRAEIAPLGKESVDLIVSEWMGYFLLFERMLPSVLAFRDRCLKKDGSIIPRAASILLGATDAPKKPNQVLSGESDGTPISEAIIETFDSENIVSTIAEVLSIDLMTTDSQFCQFQSDFAIEIQRDAEITGLVGWFNLEMTPGKWFSTSPFEGKTHWEHTLFPLIDIKQMKAGDKLCGRLECHPMDADHRALEIKLKLQNSEPDDATSITYHIR